jgi:hypothetical protein
MSSEKEKLVIFLAEVQRRLNVIDDPRLLLDELSEMVNDIRQNEYTPILDPSVDPSVDRATIAHYVHHFYEPRDVDSSILETENEPGVGFIPNQEGANSASVNHNIEVLNWLEERGFIAQFGQR